MQAEKRRARAKRKKAYDNPRKPFGEGGFLVQHNKGTKQGHHKGSFGKIPAYHCHPDVMKKLGLI